MSQRDDFPVWSPLAVAVMESYVDDDDEDRDGDDLHH